MARWVCIIPGAVVPLPQSDSENATVVQKYRLELLPAVVMVASDGTGREIFERLERLRWLNLRSYSLEGFVMARVSSDALEKVLDLRLAAS
jgi:hypothetical protein